MKSDRSWTAIFRIFVRAKFKRIKLPSSREAAIFYLHCSCLEWRIEFFKKGIQIPKGEGP